MEGEVVGVVAWADKEKPEAAFGAGLRAIALRLRRREASRLIRSFGPGCGGLARALVSSGGHVHRSWVIRQCSVIAQLAGAIKPPTLCGPGSGHSAGVASASCYA